MDFGAMHGRTEGLRRENRLGARPGARTRQRTRVPEQPRYGVEEDVPSIL